MGWRADLEESRRFAEETLATLPRPPKGPRRVVLFEVTVREAWGGEEEACENERPSLASDAMTRAPPELLRPEVAAILREPNVFLTDADR